MMDVSKVYLTLVIVVGMLCLMKSNGQAQTDTHPCGADYGRPLERFNGTQAYSNGSNCSGTSDGLYQCVDFAKRFHHKTGHSLGHGYAVCDTLATSHGFNYYANGSTTVPPKPGDVLCFSGNGAGHVGIIKEVWGNEIVVMDQNRRASTAIVTLDLTHDTRGHYLIDSFDPIHYITLGWSRDPNFTHPTTHHLCKDRDSLRNSGPPDYTVTCDEVRLEPPYLAPTFYADEDIILNAKYVNVFGQAYLRVYVERDGLPFTSFTHSPGPWDYSNDPHTAHVTPIIVGAQPQYPGSESFFRFFVINRQYLDKGNIYGVVYYLYYAPYLHFRSNYPPPHPVFGWVLAWAGTTANHSHQWGWFGYYCFHNGFIH